MGGGVSVPGQGAKIPHVMWPKINFRGEKKGSYISEDHCLKFKMDCCHAL